MHPQARLIILEVNELNLEVLRSAVESLPVPNLEKILKFQLSHTTTDDRYESDFLEPWVQWVSIHTGRPSVEHQVKHLGDVPQMEFSQIWEDAGSLGFSTGIFGVMNGDRRTAENCKFFLPDPWTFSETGYPKELADILHLPRYIARDYLNLSYVRLFKALPTFIKGIFKARAFGPALKMFLSLPSLLMRFGFKPFVFISSFDLFFSELFLKFDDKYKPDVSVVFLNSLAHLQHHQWTEELPKLSPAMQFGLINLDSAIGRLLRNFEEQDSVIVLNGLSQKNSYRSESWTLYRQLDPLNFLGSIDLKCARVEPLMTHDAHLFFDSEGDAERAYFMLQSARVENHPLFLVERDSHDSKKLFYRVNFFSQLSQDSTFKVADKTYRFFDFFKAVTVRTGSHIPGGFVLSRGLPLKDRFYNHEMKTQILDYLALRARKVFSDSSLTQ